MRRGPLVDLLVSIVEEPLLLLAAGGGHGGQVLLLEDQRLACSIASAELEAFGSQLALVFFQLSRKLFSFPIVKFGRLVRVRGVGQVG